MVFVNGSSSAEGAVIMAAGHGRLNAAFEGNTGRGAGIKTKGE
jgi:hypothetical protein